MIFLYPPQDLSATILMVTAKDILAGAGTLIVHAMQTSGMIQVNISRAPILGAMAVLALVANAAVLLEKQIVSVTSSTFPPLSTPLLIT
jgi:hypothetical protein